jgi:hypothetical protein
MLQVMRDRGITPETEVVTYCTIGNRASQAWFALKYLLGYHDVRVLLRLVDRMGKGYRHADRNLIGPSTLSKDRNASAVFSFALLVLSHFRARAGRRPRHLKRSSRLRLTCRAGRSKRR